jgi:hypothetical protein
MKPSLLAIVGLAVVIAAASPTVTRASHDPSGAPFDQDFVVGDGSTAVSVFDCCSVDMDAHSGPTGENANGQAIISARAFLVGGTVTCLRVTGNRAVVGGAFSGFGYFFVVEDNAGTGRADTISLATPPEAPTTCPAEPSDLSLIGAFTRGDLVVHDAVARPTSKDQCKNGRWRSYGVFRNQGDCVSYVATGGRNQPSGP